jgi:hypothetical protein
MDARPYTLTGDPGIEDRVHALLARVTGRVATELAPAGILLSGSFARGEGGAFLDHGELRLTSDIDLTVVYRGPASLVRSLRARSRCRTLAAMLQGECGGARIDLVSRSEVLLTWTASTLDTYQLLRSARILHGSVRLPPPAAVRLDDITPAEIRRLLVRRGAALCASWAMLQTDADALPPEEARAVLLDIDKAILACGDSWLYRFGRYDHRLAARVNRLRLPGRPRAGPSRRLQDAYERAAHDRLRPGADVPRRRSVLLDRWRGAATEWLTVMAEYESWQADPRNHAAAGRTARRLLDLGRAAFRSARRLGRGLPSETRLHRSLTERLRVTDRARPASAVDLTPGSLELSAPAHRA